MEKEGGLPEDLRFGNINSFVHPIFTIDKYNTYFVLQGETSRRGCGAMLARRCSDSLGLERQQNRIQPPLASRNSPHGQHNLLQPVLAE